MRGWLGGKSQSLPQWALILQAANNDPLRAQEIEEQVSAKWWKRYLTYLEERAAVNKPGTDKDKLDKYFQWKKKAGID